MAVRPSKTTAALLVLALACLLLSPATAIAEERTLTIDNHAAAQGGKAAVSSIRIGGVDAPEAGEPLDCEADVATAEGKSWEIPVLWVRDDLSVMPDAAVAEGGRSYLPVLVFFAPDGLELESPSFTATLSDELAALFGSDEAISVYSEQTGVTYILPASLRGLFVQSVSATQADEGAGGAPPAYAGGSGEPIIHERAAGALADEDGNVKPPDGGGVQPGDEGGNVKPSDGGDDEPAQPTLVDIHCSQTARNALSDDDLEWLVDLVVNRLEPQAVNLLLDRFPAFRAAAEKGEIGTRIGLYVYFQEGDKDGIREHENVLKGAAAYVNQGVRAVDDGFRYGYMIGVDAAHFVEKDEKGNPLVDPETGLCTLARSGMWVDSLATIIVHELFHAFMEDYNRLGMFGYAYSNDIEDEVEEEEFYEERFATAFPKWFFEGTATTVMKALHLYDLTISQLVYSTEEGFLKDIILRNYLDANEFGPVYYDLRYSEGFDEEGNPVNSIPSAYVSGYLAALYLSDLAYRAEHGGESAVTAVDDDSVDVSTEKLRWGLDRILELLHDDDSTLDGIIAGISPLDDNGDPLYHDTAEFAAEFIKGPPDEGSPNGYAGDVESLRFVTDYLYCAIMTLIDTGVWPSGSILYDFDGENVIPLDPDMQDSADFYAIVESNTLVESSVRSNTSAIGGGTSCSSNAPYVGESEKEDSIATAATQEADMPSTELAPREATADSDAAAEPEAALQDAAGDAMNAIPLESADRLAEQPLAA